MVKTETDTTHADLDAWVESRHRYETALGRLMLEWTDLEGALYKTLIRYSHVSEAVGRSIFSGTRAKGMIDFLQAIAANTTNISPARMVDLKFVFARIHVINDIRDKLIHHATQTGSMEAGKHSHQITNALRGSRSKKVWFQYITAEEVENLERDSITVRMHLQRHQIPDDNKAVPFVANRKGDGSPSTWLYKSQPPSSTNRKPRRTRK